jgi:hypothetical protein
LFVCRAVRAGPQTPHCAVNRSPDSSIPVCPPVCRAALAAISAIETYAKQGAAADGSDVAAIAAAAKAAASAPDAAGKARALQRVPAASLSKAAAAAETDVKNIMTNVAPSLNK